MQTASLFNVTCPSHTYTVPHCSPSFSRILSPKKKLRPDVSKWWKKELTWRTLYRGYKPMKSSCMWLISTPPQPPSGLQASSLPAKQAQQLCTHCSPSYMRHWPNAKIHRCFSSPASHLNQALNEKEVSARVLSSGHGTCLFCLHYSVKHHEYVLTAISINLKRHFLSYEH